jgi:UDP-N-acetyl-D-glucosamine dehydrogenase
MAGGQAERVAALRQRFADADATIGIIGLGYVGLPLVMALAASGFRVLGFDTDPAKIAQLLAGGSYIRHIPADALAPLVRDGRFVPTADFTRLAEPDAILICVPTPLGPHREPDLSYVEATTAQIAHTLRRDQLVVLESTTYPGTVDDVMKPILEADGLRAGADFFLAYSPEREDPGNKSFATSSIPKVVGGDGPDALALALALYGRTVNRTVPVSSCATAEAVKLTENIFRAVNIALVNELKLVFDAVGVDVWEVIDAAATKPFGYMPFYPGPGLGGHCIPIDPFYLTWKAREHDVVTRFVELAGEINTAMPRHVIERLAQALDAQQRRGLNGTKVLVVGLAYKRNVDDTRESPSLTLIELLEARGAEVAYYDPYVPAIPPTREHPDLAGRRAIPWTRDALAGFQAALIATDHDEVDYQTLVEAVPLVMDTRNVVARKGLTAANVVKA